MGAFASPRILLPFFLRRRPLYGFFHVCLPSLMRCNKRMMGKRLRPPTVSSFCCPGSSIHRRETIRDSTTRSRSHQEAPRGSSDCRRELVLCPCWRQAPARAREGVVQGRIFVKQAALRYTA